MTRSIDRFLIGHGFKADDLQQVRYRSVLYGAIMVMGVTAMTFFSLAAIAWL